MEGPRGAQAERVLEVEEDDGVRVIAQRTLEDLGYTDDDVVLRNLI